MIRMLTDEDIRHDAAYGVVVGRGRALIGKLGWGSASLVEQYNLLISIGCEEDAALEANQQMSGAFMVRPPADEAKLVTAWPRREIAGGRALLDKNGVGQSGLWQENG